MIKNILNQAYTFYQKYVLITSLFLGVIIIILAYGNIIKENSINEALKVVGSVIISSGVFSAIVKSSLFTDLYKTELKKIIYCDEHLKDRNDIHKLWGKISKQLYQDKFPEISEDISTTLKKYFPISSEHYYENYKYRIDISFDKEDDNYIVLDEKEDFTIKTSSKSNLNYKSSSQFNFPPKDNNKSDYELLTFKVNGEDKMPNKNELKKIRNNKESTIGVIHKREFSGKTKYLIEKTERKTYSLEVENTKSHTASWLFNNYELEVTFPKELRLKFYPKGTLNDFKIEYRKANGVNILKASYEGLMLPNQGIRLIFSKKITTL